MQAFVGSIILFAGNFAPKGWFFCDGSLLPISQYQALFSLLGTTYGGDGRVTFGLPDLRSRAPIGTIGNNSRPFGLTPVQLGEVKGNETITLIASQMPIHTHSVNANKGTAGRNLKPLPEGNFPAQNQDGSGNFADTTDIQMNAGTIGTAGGSQPIDVRSPYLGMNYIICIDGIYPSRP